MLWDSSRSRVVTGLSPDIGNRCRQRDVRYLLVGLDRSHPHRGHADVDELDIGQRALQADAGAAGRLLVDTPDFGFYAVLAGFSEPQRARAFDRRDPRKPRAADAFTSAAALRERLDAEGAGFMVVTRERAALARAVGTVQAENDRFLLVDVRP